MPSQRSRILIFLPLAILASLALPRPASAQCSFLTQQFRNIAIQASNPFVAEFSTERSTPIPGFTAALSNAGLRSAARDSEGRVRIVLAVGKYTVKAPDGTATELERQMISICDPATRTTITLDTASKSATVNAPRGDAPRILGPSGQGESFCTALFAQRKRLPRTQTEDLGHQTISGYDAVGLRVPFASLLGTGSDGVSLSYSDLWCSDEVGAVIQQTHVSKSKNGREFKNESTMQSIERREPELSLFQIPSDYTVLERAGGGTGPIGRRPALAPAGSTQPQ